VAELIDNGHAVTVQSNAGVASGFGDDDYGRAGAKIAPDAAVTWAAGDLIVKVKEPIRAEYGYLEKRHRLFSYLHLAAATELAEVLKTKGLVAVAFETVERDGRLPLLAPMSDIAGRLAVQIGTTLLHTPQGGSGVLLGGLPAAPRGRVVVIGAGHAGGNAARMAATLGASVTVFDRNADRLAAMHALGPNVTALYAFRPTVADAVANADLVIGAVLVTGARAPKVVTRDMIRRMRKGSVVVDIAVDQGGCIETTRPTDYTKPTYVEEGVTHFCVTNMPGAVPRTSSQALSASLAPYVVRLARDDWEEDEELRAGINVQNGRVVHPSVRAALEM
jgi:alanine dehydrogenase